MTQVTWTHSNECIKVYINDLLHLAFSREELIGVQSWFKGGAARMYYIQITLKGSCITCEYDDREKWAAVLAALDNDSIFEKFLTPK